MFPPSAAHSDVQFWSFSDDNDRDLGAIRAGADWIDHNFSGLVTLLRSAGFPSGMNVATCVPGLDTTALEPPGRHEFVDASDRGDRES